ncbi:Trafficking protein particle complex subunit 2-like protein [Porphyridium purpureum]|uniref:Trafficking protein particle complex subunit 2-like protein n=1 Tax=Porphyridium purpureum TaxID=35688 RepID=A0A5J4YRV4_PORPP|nr:Trafficking protein particle complex subunit 2-like protein [Porphyridium purpureum]|eukprot:POR5674..scf236_6
MKTDKAARLFRIPHGTREGSVGMEINPALAITKPDSSITEPCKLTPIEAPQVACVAVIGERNSQLFLKIYLDALVDLPYHQSQGPEVKMEEVLYSTLDIFDDYIDGSSRKTIYLGRMATVASIRLYGLLTVTNLKLIVGVRSITESDAYMKNMLIKIYRLTVKSLLNPFQPIDLMIHSRKLETGIEELVGEFPNHKPVSGPNK